MKVLDLRPYNVAALKLPFFINLVNEYRGQIAAKTVSEEDALFTFTIFFPEPTKVISFDGSELEGTEGTKLDLNYMLHMPDQGAMKTEHLARFPEEFRKIG